MEQPHLAKPTDKVPWKTRIGWGFGGLADNYMSNSLINLVLPIYNIAMGIDPALLGLALFVPRFLDAITDPLMGNISDNTRSRWGRRRPYILAGAVICGILLPLIFMPPFETDNGKLIFFTIISSVFALSYTVFVVPYTALGFELTEDYNERTRVLAWRMYIGLAGSLTVPWLYKLCLSPVFQGNAVLGAQCVCAGLGVIIILTGILPSWSCRENQNVQHQAKINIFEAISYTMSNRAFLILFIAYIIVIGGLFTSATFGLYINIYYVFGGIKEEAAKLAGYVGSATAVTSYISLGLITFISERFGKKNAMILGLIFGLAGIISFWFTLTPQMPYSQIISAVIFGLGMQGCWLMISSMTADVCDEDELKTGLRREGLYGAVTGFALKMALAVTALTGGLLLKASGYEARAAEAAGSVSPQVMLKMRLLFVGVQSMSLLIAIFMFLKYPITRARAEETRRILDMRRAEGGQSDESI